MILCSHDTRRNGNWQLVCQLPMVTSLCELDEHRIRFASSLLRFAIYIERHLVWQ